MGRMDDAARVRVTSARGWHDWLAEHHATSDGVWVVLDRRGPGHVAYQDVILEALCWGWIDGQSKPLDDDHSMLWCTRRSPRSAWSRSNKERVARLEADGRMQPPGRALVAQARSTDRWTVLDGPDALIEPDLLRHALDADPAARAEWDGFPPGVRRAALTRIALAARKPTRERLVAEIVARAHAGHRPA